MSATRWGFLGAGWIAAQALAPAVHAADGARLHAVAARSPERARALGPEGPVYGRYDELLADPDVDAVYISLANDAHHPWTLAALRAGKHVLCEKPLGMAAGQVREMFAAARAADRLLVEASWYRWHPRTLRAVELLAAGRIGRVQTVDAGFTFAGVAPGNYRLERERGGGALYDVGCYALSAVLWAFGFAAPRRVEAVERTTGPDPALGVDLATTARIRFDDGEARMHCAIDEPGRQWLTVSGSDGVLEVEEPTFTAWTANEAVLRVRAGGQAQEERFAPTDPYRLMVEALGRRVRGEPAWVLPPAQSVAVAELVECCQRSARAGQPVEC